MTHTSRPRHLARRGVLVAGALAGTVAIALSVNNAPVAHAAVNCVAGSGVTQTATTVTGSGGNDTIDCTGANPGKTINGNGGNDTITGTLFVDTINGHAGDDTMTGLVGDDILSGGVGDDTATGSDGNDKLTGGLGNDTLTGSDGADTLKGEAGNDSLTGANADGSQDNLDGGLHNLFGGDSCTGVLPDNDVRVNCELPI